MEVTGNIGAYAVTMSPSDVRLKDNITPTSVNATEAVKSFEMIEYDVVRGGSGHVALGFSAQQLHGIDPAFVNAVEQPESSPLADLGPVMNLNNNTLIAYLAKSLQEALVRIDALEAAATR